MANGNNHDKPVEQHKADPAPQTTMLPRERVLSIVNGVALTALDEMRQLRDQCDDLMRSLTDRQETLAHDIEEYAQLAEATLSAKEIMAEALANLKRQFQHSPIAETVIETAKTKTLPGTPQRSEPS